MNRPIGALQVPFHTEVDGDGVTMSVCRLDQVYYAKIKLQMKNGGKAVPASILPYVIVHATTEQPGIWTVLTPSGARTGTRDDAGSVHTAIRRSGHYRIYIKEPTETFVPGDVFIIQQHALSDGNNSGRDVQPLAEFEVTESVDCSLSITVQHPNSLSRTRGNDADSIPSNKSALKFTQDHVFNTSKQALDLGGYVISSQLWADASRTYGAQHPVIQNSIYRETLAAIYSEGLTVPTGTGKSPNDRTLNFAGREIEFNNQSTTGGRSTLSFLEDNGQPDHRMTADESLRRTHPATMEFLLKMMDELDITYVRVTGAWRPHVGSTRHRYASAIDLTHVKKNVTDENNQPQLVAIHFHREDSAASYPLRDGGHESAQRTRTREFSHKVHKYIANARAQGAAGWLGGPWALTNGELGVSTPELAQEEAFKTDSTHVHHIHISTGADQP